ncbi:phosphatase PAP2 family protein [Limnochorda pilosa]
MGEAPMYLATLTLLATSGEGETAVQVLEAIGGAAAVTWTGKVLLGRALPYAGEGSSSWAGPSLDSAHHSFPSGHASSAFALATVLAGQYPKWAAAWYVIASGVAVSLVYEGYHWPTDVIAGAVVGHLAGRAVVEGRPWLSFRWDF